MPHRTRVTVALVREIRESRKIGALAARGGYWSARACGAVVPIAAFNALRGAHLRLMLPLWTLDARSGALVRGERARHALDGFGRTDATGVTLWTRQADRRVSGPGLVAKGAGLAGADNL